MHNNICKPTSEVNFGQKRNYDAYRNGNIIREIIVKRDMYVRRGDSNKIKFRGDWSTTSLEQPDLPQTVVTESLAVMENVSENSPKTNHKDNFSVLQYYFKTKSQKWNKG